MRRPRTRRNPGQPTALASLQHTSLLAAWGLVAFLGPGCSADRTPTPTPLQWSLTPEQVYATAGPRDSLLAEVSLIAISPSGEAYIMDGLPPRVFVYDESGRLRHRFGRQGEGPGEFQSPEEMGFLADTLWVADRGLMRITLFDPSGAVIETILLGVDEGASNVVPSTLLSDGSALGSMFESPPARKIDWSALRSAVVRVSRGGVVADTLELLRVGPLWIESEAGSYYMYQPLNDSPWWVPVPGGEGIVVVDGPAASRDTDTTVDVLWIGVGGARLRRTIPYQPVPVPASFRDSIREEGISKIAGARGYSAATGEPVASGSSRSDAEKLIDEQLFQPRFFPPVTGILVGRDGTVWLRREETTEGDMKWEAVNREGTEWGSVPVPRNLRLVAVEGDRVWGVLTDEIGDFQLVRYRVERRPPKP